MIASLFAVGALACGYTETFLSLEVTGICGDATRWGGQGS